MSDRLKHLETLLSTKHDLEKEARQVIDKLRGAMMDETRKAQSIKRIQTDLDRISTDLLDAELLSGLEDLENAIEEYRGIEREGLTPEEYQDEKQSAFETIQEVIDEVELDEEALKELTTIPNTFPDNVVLRTSARWDNMVEHLGYRSIPKRNTQPEVPQAILTDEQLVMQSQDRLRNASVVPDSQLTRRQMASLELARAIANDSGRRIHAALIPPASDRVRTAGMYSRQLQEIYIAQDQLEHGSNAVDTVIHELAHHTSGLEDGEEGHNRELTRLAGEVVSATSKRTFDSLVADTEFYW